MEGEFFQSQSALTEGRGKKRLTFSERRQIVELLLNRSDKGKLNKGSITTVALQFHTTRQTCSKLWSMAKQQQASGEVIDVRSKLTGRCGKKSAPIDTERLKNTPLGQRTTMRSVGCALGISKSKVHGVVLLAFLTFQPPNSPDLNVLDLGFFRAIDSIQHRTSPKTIADLLTGVNEAFEGLSADTLNFVWLSLQLCMVEILKVNGSNGYKVPHMGKERMLREGTLPISLTVDRLVISASLAFLSSSVV